MGIQTVREIMTAAPQCCTPMDSITFAARMMADGNFGAVPVVDPQTRRLEGILTDRDITCRITARGLDPNHALVRQPMTEAPATLGPEASIHDCVQLMADRQVRRIPIVDNQGRVIGIVAQADLARATAREQELEHEVAGMIEEVSEPAHVAVAR